MFIDNSGGAALSWFLNREGWGGRVCFQDDRLSGIDAAALKVSQSFVGVVNLNGLVDDKGAG